MYKAYILYSPKLNSFYKGQTSNLENRIRRHNNKLEKSTKAGAPWLLLWSTEKKSRSEAVQLELKLKNLDRQRLIQFMLRYSNDIAGHDEALLLQRMS